ncbi:hypothetical protein SAMD00023353_1200190 [Rosellinia necatrix]|uniref:N-acetyltransferase domain-containing protein n=1 Tax=Rosellinia necatrix TaxID=77044 RepID=A0A1S8A735_ROSNE|nr:hypothetical protein SAMD00023353_1200190 [Rosellinia necatrix]
MASTDFRTYLDAMNREPLDKKSERQGSSVLLPHQRPGPITAAPAKTQQPKSRTPKKFSEEPMERGEFQDVSAVVTTITPAPDGISPNKYPSAQHDLEAKVYQNGTRPLNHQLKPSKCQSPDTNQHKYGNDALVLGRRYSSLSQQADAIKTPKSVSNGLAKSRWADPAYKGTCIGKIGQPPTAPSTPVKCQQQGTAKPCVGTDPFESTGEYSHWTSLEKKTSLSKKESMNQNSGHSPSDECYSHTHPLLHNEPQHTKDSGWDEPRDGRYQNRDLRPQPPVATASLIGENAEVNVENASKLTQVNERRVSEQIYTNAVPESLVNWPAESSIADGVNQHITNQDWDQNSQPQREPSDEMSSSAEGAKVIPQYITDFIITWIRGAHTAQADFLYKNIDGHEECDVDPYEGILMKPIDYPRTKTPPFISPAQFELSSTLRMKEFAVEVARRNPQNKAQRAAEKQARAAARAAAAAAATAEIVIEEPPNPNEIQIPCHLRPATESDIEAITAIYNQEVEDGYKVIDTKPVREEEFHKIYRRSLAEEMPFIVAVEGSHEVIDTSDQHIIGFSLVTVINQGIAGSYETLYSRGGKLVVIVKPEYRFKKIGTALTDILITNCTGWYTPKCGYQFVNFTNDWISTEFGRNPRKWWYLEMEIMVRSGASKEETQRSDEFRWFQNFLELKFDLLLTHHDEKCCFSPHQMRWLDKLTFRRDCRGRGN